MNDPDLFLLMSLIWEDLYVNMAYFLIFTLYYPPYALSPFILFLCVGKLQCVYLAGIILLIVLVVILI